MDGCIILFYNSFSKTILPKCRTPPRLDHHSHAASLQTSSPVHTALSSTGTLHQTRCSHLDCWSSHMLHHNQIPLRSLHCFIFMTSSNSDKRILSSYTLVVCFMPVLCLVLYNLLSLIIQLKMSSSLAKSTNQKTIFIFSSL